MSATPERLGAIAAEDPLPAMTVLGWFPSRLAAAPPGLRPLWGAGPREGVGRIVDALSPRAATAGALEAVSSRALCAPNGERR
jgi:hypothetical protein